MIELLDLNTENTLGYRIDGKIDKADMERVFDVIEQKLEDSGQLNFYAEVKSLNVAEVSPDAIFEELRRLIRHPSTLVNIRKG
ncbi:MAG: STAS/SEC14 domain-containing protein, partial [Acidobacteriota bacterium]|nr:STAS/SEC14 domain-containing protein [Acidobacteriota bacterium]